MQVLKIQIQDADSRYAMLTVTAHVQHGQLYASANQVFSNSNSGSTATSSQQDFGPVCMTSQEQRSLSCHADIESINRAFAALVYAPDTDYHGEDVLQIHISDNSNSGKCPKDFDAALYAAKGTCALTSNSTAYIHICAINDPPILTVPSPDKLVLEEGKGDLQFALYIQDADASVYPDMLVEIQFESKHESRGT
jgi:hypothetical protein